MLTGLKTVGWQLAALALAVLLAAQTLRLNSALLASATAKTTLSAEREMASRAALTASQRYRSLEGDYRESIDKIAAVGNAGIQHAADDADRARAARDSMRRELADYLTAHRTAALARAAAGECTPDTRAVGVLAELFDRADHRAGELAAIADEARVRGLACESAHDSARTLMEAAAHAQAR